MVSQLMSQALDDLARRRRISRSLSLPEILRPMWVAATNIRERDPEKGLRLMAALVIISLSNDEKKATCGKQVAARRSAVGPRPLTTSNSTPRYQPVNRRQGSILGHLLVDAYK